MGLLSAGHLFRNENERSSLAVDGLDVVLTGSFESWRRRHSVSATLVFIVGLATKKTSASRHWCETDDGLDQYGWLQHDGRTFGYQEIKDYPFTLETSFVKFPNNKYGGDWTARISVRDTAGRNESVSLIWYTALDEKTGGFLTPTTVSDGPSLTGVHGETPGLGEFSMDLNAVNGTVLHSSYLSTVSPSVQHMRQVLTSQLYLANDKTTRTRFIALPGEILRNNKGETFEPNFVATMVTVKTPFTLDVSYRSLHGLTPKDMRTMPGPPIGKEYTEVLNEKRTEFNNRFERTFHLKEKGYTQAEVDFAQGALSNMIGGIGYFHGSSRVQSTYTKEPVPYWKSSLYSSVPSRSFFPRGFLWDEGFHGLLIATWDLDIEMDILNHWMDLMNVEGWIPREQILGPEALAKVPEEYVTQRNTIANPPTFFLTLKMILSKYSSAMMTSARLTNLERLYPRLQAWINWYNTTQRGDVPGTYRWRGHEEYKPTEINPKTMASGLDDYPRSSHPTDDERHVDLRCWIAFASGVMAELAHLLGRDDSKYWETHYYLSDNSLLNELHLSPYTESYADWGLHTDDVELRLVRPTTIQHEPQMQNHMSQEKQRVTLKQPEQRFVDSEFGYVSLFPFLLEIMTPDSVQLERLLKNIRDPEILWTNFGLRSLSKQSPLYMKRNTEHDPPYWRGQIWININYLALKALHHYGTQPGPYNENAKRIYLELRHNVVKNIFSQYKRSGYIWEQYNDKTGEGSGCKPFTGWSSLVVLIMAEQY